MNIGYLYEKKEKEVEEDVKKGAKVSIGVNVDSLLDTINVYEINNPNNPAIVLALLKKDCMLILGKVKNEVENKE